MASGSAKGKKNKKGNPGTNKKTTPKVIQNLPSKKKTVQKTQKTKKPPGKNKKDSCSTCLKCNRLSSCRKKGANPKFCGHHQPNKEKEKEKEIKEEQRKQIKKDTKVTKKEEKKKPPLKETTKLNLNFDFISSSDGNSETEETKSNEPTTPRGKVEPPRRVTSSSLRTHSQKTQKKREEKSTKKPIKRHEERADESNETELDETTTPSSKLKLSSASSSSSWLKPQLPKPQKKQEQKSTKKPIKNEEEEETEEQKNERRTAFLTKLRKFVYSSPKKGDVIIDIQDKNWFEAAMGFPENKWNPKKYLKIDPKTKNVFINKLQAGQFTQQTLGELEENENVWPKKQPPTQTQTCIPIVLMIAPHSPNDSFVDVKALQFFAPPNSVFQVASNFNGIEGVNDSTSPENDSEYMTNYIYDKTQGPAASISAPAGAFQRIYCPTYLRSSSKIKKQGNEFQLNMLENLTKYFPVMKNGYPILHINHPTFPSSKSKEYDQCLKKGKVFTQRQTEVNIYSQGTPLELTQKTYLHTGAPIQTVTQVLCAAFNIGQPSTGKEKNKWQNANRKDSSDRVQFCLDLAYRGTYCVARQEKSPNLFLTLMGGGAFRNSKARIVASILKQHLIFGRDEHTNPLKIVYVVLFVDGECLKIFKKQVQELQNEKIYIPLWLWSADQKKVTEKLLV